MRILAVLVAFTMSAIVGCYRGNGAECPDGLRPLYTSDGVLYLEVGTHTVRYDTYSGTVIKDDLYWDLYDDRMSVYANLVNAVLCTDSVAPAHFAAVNEPVARGAVSVFLLHELFDVPLRGEASLLGLNSGDCKYVNRFPCHFVSSFSRMAPRYHQWFREWEPVAMDATDEYEPVDPISIRIDSSLVVAIEPVRGQFVRDSTYAQLRSDLASVYGRLYRAFDDRREIYVSYCGGVDSVSVASVAVALLVDLFDVRCSEVVSYRGYRTFSCLRPCDFSLLELIDSNLVGARNRAFRVVHEATAR